MVQTATGTEYKRKQHAQKRSREVQTNGMQRLGSRRALIHDSVATAGACFLHGGSLEDTVTRGKTNASRLRIAAVRVEKIFICEHILINPLYTFIAGMHLCTPRYTCVV
jgi:hypothetical protein